MGKIIPISHFSQVLTVFKAGSKKLGSGILLVLDVLYLEVPSLVNYFRIEQNVNLKIVKVFLNTGIFQDVFYQRLEEILKTEVTEKVKVYFIKLSIGFVKDSVKIFKDVRKTEVTIKVL